MSSKKSVWSWQTALPLLSGLVGVLVGGFISFATVERQIQVSHEAEQRSVRAEAYLALIDAADDYANSTDSVLDAHQLRGEVSPDVIDTMKADVYVSSWLNARNAFQEALNQIYVYGSSEGWDAAIELAGTLPYSRGEDYEWVEVSSNLTERYNGVLAVICEEATISPRADCSAD